MKVCWQVTGIRQDKWAKDQPLAVEQDKRSEDVRFLDAQSPQQVEAFNRWLKEDQAETQALMSAQSQRMEEVRKAVETKKKK
jgi:predicted phosphoadenosine phosphosulfate sulfurtransferase